MEEVFAAGVLEGPNRPIAWDLRWYAPGPSGLTLHLDSYRSSIGLGHSAGYLRLEAEEDGLRVVVLFREADDVVAVNAPVGFVRQNGDVDRVLAYFDGLDEPLRLEMVDGPNGTETPLKVVYGVTLTPRRLTDQLSVTPYLCSAALTSTGEVIAVDATHSDSPEKCPVSVGDAA